MSEVQEMSQYYRQRAPVYDRVYRYPERQTDLRFLESHVPTIFRDRTVLEVAAGTGYWTQFIAREAKSVLATDSEEAQLAGLERRRLDLHVEPRVLNAFHLDRLADENLFFEGAFAGLWISHVPKQRLTEFFCALHQCLRPGSEIVLLDNSPAQCAQYPISHRDEFGNTYQRRELDSGEKYSVLKNFPNLDALNAMTASFGEFRHYLNLENFWVYQYVSTR